MAAVSHLKRVNVFVYQARAPLYPSLPLVALRPYGPSPAQRLTDASSSPTVAPSPPSPARCPTANPQRFLAAVSYQR